MEGQSGLEINNVYWRRGGCLGRRDYFFTMVRFIIYYFILGVIAFVVNALFMGAVTRGQMYGSTAASWLFFLGIIAGFISLYIGYLIYITAFKRIRDIRGTLENENWFQFGYVMIMLTGVVSPVFLAVYGFPFSFFMFLKKGAVSDGESAIPMEKIYNKFLSYIH